MPQKTALRRVSTLVVGALFAVVFVCSGASVTHGVVGESATSAHTATSKAAARTAEPAVVVHKSPASTPLHLATVGPAGTDDSPVFAAEIADEDTSTHHSRDVFTTSERAPPGL